MFNTYLDIKGKIVNPDTIRSFLLTLQDKKYILVGGQALLLYMEGRTTQDIDILVNPDTDLQLDDLQSNKDFGRGIFEGLIVDLLYTSNSFFNYIFKQDVVIKEVEGLSIAVASPLSLILLKCYALPALYRQGLYRKIDIYESDLKGLFRIYPDAINLLTVLKSYMLTDDYNNVIEICKDLTKRI